MIDVIWEWADKQSLGSLWKQSLWHTFKLCPWLGHKRMLFIHVIYWSSLFYPSVYGDEVHCEAWNMKPLHKSRIIILYYYNIRLIYHCSFPCCKWMLLSYLSYFSLYVPKRQVWIGNLLSYSLYLFGKQIFLVLSFYCSALSGSHFLFFQICLRDTPWRNLYSLVDALVARSLSAALLTVHYYLKIVILLVDVVKSANKLKFWQGGVNFTVRL